MSFNKLLKNHCILKNNRLCFGLDVDNQNLKNTSLDYMGKYIEDIMNVVVLTTIASALEYIYNYRKDILVKNFKLTSTYESTNTYISKKC